VSPFPLVVLVGRPNVGKSTLFNRLTRTRAALVDDREGVTRDWIERDWRLHDDCHVRLRDLCGFREQEDDPVLKQSQETMKELWHDADLILLVVDGRVGISESDRWVASMARSANKPVILAANKVDISAAEADAMSAAELGWDPVLISAEHNYGIEELEEVVEQRLPEKPLAPIEVDVDVKIAILGKPNAGKSTLLNRLLDEERATVSEIAGTTRDPIDAVGKMGEKKVMFMDTAGIRRRRSITDQLEAATVSRSLRSARQADIVLYLIRADDGITQQDQTVLARIATYGVGLLLLISHWDRVEDGDQAFKRLLAEKDRLLPFLDFAPMITLSALTGHNASKIDHWIDLLLEELDREVSTPEMNRILSDILISNPPPAVQIRSSRRSKKRKPLKIMYGTQSGRRPLQFRLFGNINEGDLPKSYERYLINQMRERLNVTHVPILLDVEGRGGHEQ